MNRTEKRYYQLLREKFPTKQAVYREIINLNAILNLPKGTEHFMSDLHGEYEAFYHILNNCSGVIKEKVQLVLGKELSRQEQRELCTLIYYPKEKLYLLQKKEPLSGDWYREKLYELIEVAKLLSSKYTRSKVRKALPEDFAYIIDELIHVQKDEDDNQVLYHKKIIDTIIELDNAKAFIEALAALIKRLAVDHLHIVGDIFDRGASPDKILDLLMEHHSLDIEWGNHDVLWMGAACGNEACIANAIRNNVRYDNAEMLEQSYGISLRKLVLFAEKYYPQKDLVQASYEAISLIMFKLEGALIGRHPEYEMDDHLFLDKLDLKNGRIRIDGIDCEIDPRCFPTLDPEHPYQLTEEEQEIMVDFKMAFQNSTTLQGHIAFLYENGSMYRIFNQNLLFHGCIPMDEDGNFMGVNINGRMYKGREYMDIAEKMIRRAYEKEDPQALDLMWYLWCGKTSPLSGRSTHTFQKMYIQEETLWVEEKNPYFTLNKEERICKMILREFGLYTQLSHIINGHTPVKTQEGEEPVRANGRLIIIDGGFCEKYHKTTGIAGYTLIYNSHGLRLKAHQPFESIQKALTDNRDIDSVSRTVETERERVMVRDTDVGKGIQEEIEDYERFLEYI